MRIRADKTPSLYSFDDAARHISNTVPWRGSNEYPLDARKKRHISIRYLNDTTIACRLYRTDVVTFRPDQIIIDATYASMSTDSVVNAILGSGVGWLSSGARSVSKPAMYLSQGDRFVRFTGTLRLIRDPECVYTWVPHPDDIVPWQRPYVNRKAANAFLRSIGWPTFEAWMWARAAGSQVKNDPLTPLVFPADVERVVRAGPTTWAETFDGNIGINNVRRQLDHMRYDLYERSPDCIEVEVQDVLHSWQDRERFTSAEARWALALSRRRLDHAA